MNYPPCKLACPIQTEAREYIQLIAERRYDDALLAIQRQNPLPRVCGRICTHPCEGLCKRGQIDAPIAIASLKRFASDGAWRENSASFFSTKKDMPKVAVIGSGPAGLSAAYFLARLGHPVTVFEKLPVLGGMMAVGIPSYRLPREVLAEEIDTIKKLGVEMRTGVSFGEDVTLDSLQRDGFKAVFLALGLHVSRRLNVPGEDLPGVLKGVDFLRDAGLGNKPVLGRRVVVIGGGNVAVDVARTALRVGAKEVSMVALEKEDEMPAWESEIEGARQEGVALLNCYGPKAFLEKDGRLAGVEFKYCSCVFDEKGAFCPTYNETELKGLAADTVIVAIGQAADLSAAKQQDLAVTKRGGLQVDPDTLITSREGVFAGGDVVSGPATVTDAIAMGKRAATSIYLYLQGEPLAVPARISDKTVESLPEKILQRSRSFDRAHVDSLTVQQRLCGFNEVESGLPEEKAVDEALRCLHCYMGARIDKDRCISCLTCVRVCPVQIPSFGKTGEITIDPFLCQACGMCVVECPVRAIDISLDSRNALAAALKKGPASVPDPDHPDGKVVVFIDLYGRFGAQHIAGFKQTYPYALPLMVFGLRRIDVADMLQAFQEGAGAVLLLRCPQDRDPFPEAANKVEARVERARSLLKAIGMDPDRIQLWDMPSEGIVEKERMDTFFAKLSDQGQSVPEEAEK